MKIKLFGNKLYNNILFVALSFLIATFMVVFFFYFNFNAIYKDIQEQNLTSDHNNYQLNKLNNTRNTISEIIKDVNLTSFYVVNFIRNGETKVESERNKIWDRRILPKINAMEDEIDQLDFSDEFRSRLNILVDLIYTNKDIQEKLVKDGRDVDEASSLVNESLDRLSNSYENLSNSRVDVTFNPYKYFDVVNHTRTSLIVSSIVIILLTIVLIRYLYSVICTPIKQLEHTVNLLKQGELPADIQLDYAEYKGVNRAMNNFFRKLNTLKKYSEKVSTGEFEVDATTKVDNEGELGQALSKMQHRLAKVAEEDMQRTHINQGLAKFSEILGNNTNNLSKFGDEVIINLVKFLNANQGAFFVVNDEDNMSHYLELVSCYAYNKKKYLDQKIVKGQGLVGQAWQEGQPIYMTKVPQNYVNITSGLGYSTPRCVLIMPLNFNEQVHGIIELASFNPFQDYEIGFVEKVCESISSALSSVKINSKTQMLLEQSESLAKKMSLQEEEMRKNVEELRITQEESQRREEQHLRQIKRLKKRLEEYEKNLLI